MGGVNRSASGSVRRGASRGFGSDLSKSSAVVSAHIIDLQEMDEAILGGTPKEFLARARAQEAMGNGNPTRTVDPNAEGKALVRYARKLHKKGDQSGAFDVYMMAMKKLSPSLRDLAKAEFKKTFGSAADQALRMRRLAY